MTRGWFSWFLVLYQFEGGDALRKVPLRVAVTW
jgi:hypothetical protein